MRILMIGDVVGKPGRNALLQLLPDLRKSRDIDFVIVNGENAAGGMGITPEIALNFQEEMRVDVITLGNHAWAKKEIYPFLDSNERILRPANFPPDVPGRGMDIYETSKGNLAVVVLQGRTFMEPTDDPFRLVDAIIKKMGDKTTCIFIDFHGEATSEKMAFGWYVNGRVSAVIGTHTHVQTSDERILPGGTAYITDVGMTGPTDSVIGMKCDVIIPRFTKLLPTKFEVAEGQAHLCAVVVELNPITGKALQIERIKMEC